MAPPRRWLCHRTAWLLAAALALLLQLRTAGAQEEPSPGAIPLAASGQAVYDVPCPPRWVPVVDDGAPLVLAANRSYALGAGRFRLSKRVEVSGGSTVCIQGDYVDSTELLPPNGERRVHAVVGSGGALRLAYLTLRGSGSSGGVLVSPESPAPALLSAARVAFRGMRERPAVQCKAAKDAAPGAAEAAQLVFNWTDWSDNARGALSTACPTTLNDTFAWTTVPRLLEGADGNLSSSLGNISGLPLANLSTVTWYTGKNTFKDNSNPGGNGGAIAALAGGGDGSPSSARVRLSFDGMVVFMRNAAARGGALYTAGAEVRWTSSSLWQGNQAAGGGGGAICAAGGAGGEPDQLEFRTSLFRPCSICADAVAPHEFSGNGAVNGSGGALLVEAAEVALGGSSCWDRNRAGAAGAAIAIQGAAGAPAVRFRGSPLAHNFGGNVLTGGVHEDLYASPGAPGYSPSFSCEGGGSRGPGGYAVEGSPCDPGCTGLNCTCPAETLWGYGCACKRLLVFQSLTPSPPRVAAAGAFRLTAQLVPKTGAGATVTLVVPPGSGISCSPAARATVNPAGAAVFSCTAGDTAGAFTLGAQAAKPGFQAVRLRARLSVVTPQQEGVP